MSNPVPNDLTAALEFTSEQSLAAAAGEPVEIEGHPRLMRWVVPVNYKVESLPLEVYQAHPDRKKGTATLRDLTSFIEYVKDHREDGATSIYREDKQFTAILNGHDQLRAGWGDHRAIFSPKWTPSWTAWESFNNAQISQDDFAQFLTDRIPDIGAPPAAEILGAVENLRLHWNATYERVVQPNNDFVQLTYVEDATAGSIRVPAKFTILLKPFEGAEAVVLEVSLRFLKPDAQGRVKFQFRLEERVSRVVDDEFLKMQERIASETGVPVYWGSFAGR